MSTAEVMAKRLRSSYEIGREERNLMAAELYRLVSVVAELERKAEEHRDGRLAALERVAQLEAAAKQMLDAVDTTHDTKLAPQKYAVQYRAVNALRAALLQPKENLDGPN